MTAIALTTANVRPANAHQCIIRTIESGEAVDVGEAVYIKAADGLAYLVDGSASASALAVGICVAVGSQGVTAGAAAGDMLSIVLFGPVAGFTVDPGDLIYVSDDPPGGLADAVGTYVWAVGIGIPDSLIFVNPGLLAPPAAV